MKSVGLKAEEFCSHVLGQMTDQHVVIGPAVLDEKDTWYFTIAVKRKSGFWLERMDIGGPLDRDVCMFRLAQDVSSRGRVIHDMGDELSMARMCAALWPTARTKHLAKLVAAEDEARTATKQ